MLKGFKHFVSTFLLLDKVYFNHEYQAAVILKSLDFIISCIHLSLTVLWMW